MKSMKLTKIADTVVTYLILIVVCFIFLFPCLWLILASFSKSGSIYSFDGFFPSAYSLDTFRNLFTDTEMYNYPQWFRNTLFIAVMSCLIGTFLVILTAYTMSRFQFKGRKMIMKTTLILGMFPSFMGMIFDVMGITYLKLSVAHTIPQKYCKCKRNTLLFYCVGIT